MKRKRFNADGSLTKKVAVCGSKEKTGAGEGVDWEPPAGMAAIAHSRHTTYRQAGIANPFAFGPLWLGKAGPVTDVMKEMSGVSVDQKVGSVVAQASEDKPS